MSSMLGVIAQLAQANSQFPKQASVIVIPGIIDKITDAKVKGACTNLFLALIEVFI